MHSSIFSFVVAITLATTSAQATTSVAIGAICTSSSECPTGVECYAVNSMLEARCGNTGATCTLDAECLTSSCISGTCGGVASPTTSSTPTTATAIPVGSSCISGGTACANGAQCYAVNADANPICGNFGATCTSNSQCGFNLCVSGTCSGIYSSSFSVVTSSGEATATSTVVPLGGVCTPSSSTCANGSQCYALQSNLIPCCGNMGAVCTTDSQCAFNTCVRGFCFGLLSSSSTTYSSVTTVASVGFSASVTVVGGKTTSMLANLSGASTSFGSTATATTATSATISPIRSNDAGRTVCGFETLLAFAFGAVILL